MNQRRREASVDLVAHTTHVDVHQIRARIEIVVPDFFEDLHASTNTALRAQKIFQQTIFSSREMDAFSRALHVAADGVHGQICQAQNDRPGIHLVSSGQCAHTSNEFSQGKRFGEIIIRARIQSFDPLVHRTPRGK